MIVILILSVLFSIMFGVYYGAARIASYSSPESNAREKAMLTLEMIRSTINQTYWQRNIDRLIFIGRQDGAGERRKDRLTFAAVHPGAEAVGVAAVREVSFYVKDSEDGESGTLIRREDQMVDSAPNEGGAHYPVLENVVSFKLRYSLTGREWKESWNSKQLRRMPRLVQVQILIKIRDKISRFETLASPGLYIK